VEVAFILLQASACWSTSYSDAIAIRRRKTLLLHDLRPAALPLLSAIFSRQDAEIARLANESLVQRKLMMLVKRNSRSALTDRNQVDIKQNGVRFYASLIDDLKTARHSAHLQCFIWAADSLPKRCDGS
jgi:cardiolipin synthase A/B